jgi:hypothetical protein
LARAFEFKSLLYQNDMRVWPEETVSLPHIIRTTLPTFRKNRSRVMSAASRCLAVSCTFCAHFLSSQNYQPIHQTIMSLNRNQVSRRLDTMRCPTGICCSILLCPRLSHLTSRTSHLNAPQVAGHLGAANNSQMSSSTQHSSRQAVMQSAAQGSSGRSSSSIAGQIGVTTNPQVSSSGQHSARQGVMNAAANR